MTQVQQLDMHLMLMYILYISYNNICLAFVATCNGSDKSQRLSRFMANSSQLDLTRSLVLITGVNMLIFEKTTEL